MDGEALAQELGIPRHLDVDALGREPAGPFRQFGGRADRHRRLADDHRAVGVSRGTRVSITACTWRRSAPYSPFFCGVPTPRKCTSANVGGLVVVGGEAQPAGGEVVAQHLSQTGLVERDVAGRELGDLACVDVDADHVVPEFGHPGGMRRAEIARAEDGASHEPIAMRRG